MLKLRIEEVADGEARILYDGDRPIVITRAGEKVVAFDGMCTHQDEPFDGDYLDCTVITCPAHFSEFDALTGAVLEEPATEALKPVPVRVADGVAWIGEGSDAG